MAGVQVGGPRPTCFVDYRTGQKSGDCSSSAPPAAAPPPSAAAPPPDLSSQQQSSPSSPNITYNFPQPPPLTAPEATTSPIAAPAAQPQQPQSLISLGNQMKQPLDAINEDAMPSLRDNLGRRTPPSMSALLAQMARVY